MKFFRELFNQDRPETEGQVLFFRLFEAIVLYQLIFFAWTWGFYIPQLGDVILPLGMAHYIDVSFMFNPVVSLTNAVLITLCAILGFFYKGRYWYLFALIGIHFQYAARYSQGEISHGANFTAMALVAFAIAAIFFSDKTERRKIAMGLFIFFIGLGYTSAACCKLVVTGFSWVDGSHLYLWIGERSTDRLSQAGTFHHTFFQQWVLRYHWMATATLCVGILTEFFGFLLWFRKTRWVEATFLICMHIGVYMSMVINFGSYVFILLVVGYPWGVFFDSLLSRIPETRLHRYLEREAAPS